MHIPPNLIIHETTHWLINHRLDSHLPGYLMLSAKQMTHSLTTLPNEALTELGPLQAKIQHAIETHLHPNRLYIGRFGHDAGHSIHFHFIPIYTWIEALFWQDERYRSLQAFGSLPDGSNQTDGAELTLFVWREFCERPDPPSIEGLSIDQAITVLQQAFSADTSV